MSNLALITTETFNNLSCNFYRNMNDDILLTREQIGQALEYTDPMVAIGKIHNRHSDRLDQFSFTNLVNGHQIYYYTEKGVMEICRWSKSKRANEFMDWTWDVITKYRHNELNTTPNIQPLIDAITTLTETVTTMQQDISSLKQQSTPKKLVTQKYSRWKTNIFDKLKTLTKYANEHSDQELSLSDTLHITINEMQDTYNIELSDYIRDYMLENSSETKPYDLDVINYYKNIRNMYTLTVNSIMDRLNLQEESSIKRNIFDELAKNL